MGKDYLRAASVEIAVIGFRKTGIFPVNEHVFRKHDFIIHVAEATAVKGQSSTLQADI
jgi:hypothetical protein